MPEINKKIIHKLKDLARIEILSEREERLESDLANIIQYFNEIESLNLKNIKPNKNIVLNNVLRNDEEGNHKFNLNKLVDAFPEKKSGFLKIPPVF